MSAFLKQCLPLEIKMNAVWLSGVQAHARLYSTIGLWVKSTVTGDADASPTVEEKTVVVFTTVGKGYFGFVGDQEYRLRMVPIYAAMLLSPELKSICDQNAEDVEAEIKAANEDKDTANEGILETRSFHSVEEN